MINFKEFPLYANITKSKTIELDVREDFANMIYMKTQGIRSHALAYKILQSAGDTEYDEQEVQIIKQVAEAYCTPAFVDSLNDILDKKEE